MHNLRDVFCTAGASMAAPPSHVTLLSLIAVVSANTACERGLTIAKRSKCPSNRWKDFVTESLVNTSSAIGGGAPLLYVNVGANKGFAVAEVLQRFHDDGGRTPSNREWHRSIKIIKPSGMFGCGMCSACKDPKPELRHNRSVRVVAFELLKPNHLLLTKLFARHAVPGVAIHAAVSNYTGTAYAPTGVRTGQEWTSAEIGEQASAGSPSGTAHAARRGRAAVPSTTIDAWAARDGLRRIDWLSIDAEGWDALILEGSAALLSSRSVELLEFEYHHKGLWDESLPPGERRNLKSVLATLHASGYACFWQVDKGSLAEANGARWCESFEFRAHSNMVCAHREPLVRALRGLDQGAGAGAD